MKPNIKKLLILNAPYTKHFLFLRLRADMALLHF